MRDKSDRPDRSKRPPSQPDPPVVDDERAHKAIAERSEAHRRWVADDGDVACRGID